MLQLRFNPAAAVTRMELSVRIEMTRKPFMFLLGGVLCGLLVSMSVAQSKVQKVVKPMPATQSGDRSAKQTIKVMLVDGQSAGAYHNWRLTTPVLKREL